MRGTDLILSAPPFVHIPLLERLAPTREAGFAGLTLMPGDNWSLENQGISAIEIRSRIGDQGLRIMELDCAACWLPSHRRAGDDIPMAALLRSLTPDE